MKTIIIKSDRKTISLSIDDDLNIVVRAPYLTSQVQINNFVNENSHWIDKALERKKKYLERNTFSPEQQNELIKKAKEIIPERVKYYSEIMGLYPSGVKITSAKKRFGSCSAKNSLCFSYILMSYPMEAVDYVVVHELAHIKHHNHGREFYALIEKYLPDYKQREMLLKQ
ncbi:MAG: M48 family metallopeptidase [Eubacterium sp.]